MFLSAKIGKGYVVTCAMISAMLIVVILCFLAANSWQAFSQVGLGLFGWTWNPPKGQFGMLPMIYGSLAVTVIALGIAFPLGIATAVFTSEMLSATVRVYAKSFLELLAGIPSIVYGLMGVAFLSVFVQDVFVLLSGRTILTGGILLSIMILPTVITLCDDAMHHIPMSYREAARGLGLYKYEVVKDVVLPAAKMDILGALLLALGRVLGETMAVMLVIGSLDKIPTPFWNVLAPGQTITSKLGREMAEAAFGSLHFEAMIAMALILLFFVLTLTVVSLTYFYNPEGRLYE
ncbi:MAG: phosphate ABC transporter permease subunit PstC [Candidatus Latescibacteria bacterium]|jgi:phosphate transport system permease protein|nr:phosphate ABC transporter permease subunit PstC [Candidatus Latescibacterota bacterium]MBT4141233.1 phosphate ABC transporter permease subunit PstC [Candidatus Latescibacterota bacterium]